MQKYNILSNSKTMKIHLEAFRIIQRAILMRLESASHLSAPAYGAVIQVVLFAAHVRAMPPPAISGCQGVHPRSFVRGSVSSVRRSAGCTRRDVWTLHFERFLAFRQFRRGRRPPRPRPPALGWSWPYVWPRQLTNPWGWMHGVRPPRTRLRGARAVTPIPVEHLGLSSLVICSWAPVFTD